MTRLTDFWYWIDSLPAIVVAMIALWVFMQIAGGIGLLWAHIIQFFQATEVPGPPPANPGPSPFAQLLNCLFSVIMVIGLVGVVIFVLWNLAS